MVPKKLTAGTVKFHRTGELSMNEERMNRVLKRSQFKGKNYGKRSLLRSNMHNYFE